MTRNAGVTTDIGRRVQAAARAGLHYAERKVHQTGQDDIAAVAGALPTGATAHWQVVHKIPIEADQHGDATVSGSYGCGGFACKEIVLSIEHDGQRGTTREFYIANICLDGTRWQWAAAEPTTARWRALQ